MDLKVLITVFHKKICFKEVWATFQEILAIKIDADSAEIQQNSSISKTQYFQNVKSQHSKE